MGRPSEYSADIATSICERLSEGESLREICRSENMPAKGTVFRWLARYEEFKDQYARAREVQADAIFDEILEIADDASNDWMEREGDGGLGYQLNGEHIQRSKLRIDARKWMAGKLRPKVYGEKITQEHQGPDGGPIHFRDVTELTDEELASIATASSN